MRPYMAPPPPGAQPPPLWGDEAHVRELLADGVTDLAFRRDTLVVDHFGTPQEFVDFFKRTYGPTIVAYRGLADDQARAAALDAELLALARDAARPAPDGGITMEWEYLLVTATRS
jgi:hypothetical protein